ncbi:MAG TPA: DUF4389 domain-containing protein [Bacillota bacterium]
MNTVQVSFDYPERLSRGILLLKTFLGFIILIPHLIALFALGIAAGLVMFISWFAVLFTGKYPQSLFDFEVGVQDWGLRVSAYMGLLRDEYPVFGLEARYPSRFQVHYPDKLSRGILLLRLFFGWIYVMIPHGVCLLFRGIAYLAVTFVAWWAVLFTGKMPRRMFNFLAGTLRWNQNLNAYLMFLTDEYPPFTGKENGSGSAGTGFIA